MGRFPCLSALPGAHAGAAPGLSAAKPRIDANAIAPGLTLASGMTALGYPMQSPNGFTVTKLRGSMESVSVNLTAAEFPASDYLEQLTTQLLKAVGDRRLILTINVYRP